MIEVRQLCHTFADGTVGLNDLTFRVKAGECVLLTGPSGGGKTTLLRILAGLMEPTSGEVIRRGRVGLVFQEPGDQLLCGTVREELELCARAVGEQIEAAVLLEEVGLEVPLDAAPTELSGGQQQRLAVAGGLAGGAPILLLDEPLAHLDPEGAEQLLALLKRRAAEGDAVLLVEHRLELAMRWADRVVLLDQGKALQQSPTAKALRALGLRPPASLVVEERGGLSALGPRERRHHDVGEVLWEGQVRGLHAEEIRLRAGERVAWMGANGAGKSTLLEGLAQALGPLGVWVPQDPDLSLFCSTAGLELASAATERGLSTSVRLDELGLVGLEERAPQSLSKGQRLRLAVGAALAARPTVLLLDEPTAGQHGEAVDAVMALVAAKQSEGAVVFATHDLELALRWATRVVVISEGRIVTEGCPGEVFVEPLPWLQRQQLELHHPMVDLEQQLEGPPGPTSLPTRGVQSSAPAHPRRRPYRETSITAVLVLLMVGALAILLDRPLTLWGLAILSFISFMLRPIALKIRLFAVLGAVGIVWTTLLSQGLFYGDEPRSVALRLGPIVFWWEGLRWGLVQSARLVAVSFAGLGVAMSTAPDRLTALLRGLGVPGVLAFLSVMAIRFVPVVAGEWASVRRARARRGVALWRRGPVAWLQVELSMLQPLVARSLRRALRLAESLDSRGFDVREPPVEVAHWTRWDRGALVVLGALVVGIISLQLLHALYLWEVWYDPSLRPLYAMVRRWL